MPVIDLIRYIVSATGPWTDPTTADNLFGFTKNDTMSPERLLLRWAGDMVALAGPLSVSVTVQAENMTLPLALVPNLAPVAGAPSVVHAPGVATLSPAVGLAESAVSRFAAAGGALSLQASTIYSYTLEIPAGQAWPFSLSEQLDALRLQNLTASRWEHLGNNLGYRVLIEPAFALSKLRPIVTGADLPCDFAVADQPHSASFFPVACEPCEGTVIGLPPSGVVTLVTPPADGGCVRTRFFNGMFITQEDLEAEQRYWRLKSRLHNRAAGAGVVWGLGVGRQGDQVCVRPGYAVDCCGNDLALTTLYKVRSAALLADPAAAALARQPGPQRLHLLLEYVECPSDPRPVHGDPCVPEATRCEMSRIRESVRLRLVPPRDYQPSKESAPLAHFLAEVRQLRANFPLGQLPGVLAPASAPFRLRVTTDATTGPTTAEVRPSTGVGPIANFPGGVRDLLRVELAPDPLWRFVRGTLSGRAFSSTGALLSSTGLAPKTVELSQSNASPVIEFQMPSAGASRPARLEITLTDWQAQSFLAAPDDLGPSGSRMTLNVLVSQEAITEHFFDVSEMGFARLDLAPSPCFGEPCSPPQRVARDPAGNICQPTAQADFDPTPVLPWLHPDPIHPSTAGDPKGLVLAALGAWLSQMQVQEKVGTPGEVLSSRREIAQGIFRAAWLLLFGVPERAEPLAVGGTLKRLLEAWCDKLLWTGPQCWGDPHGVVIGCARVEAGAIQGIDPFGGRRHVIHYPLLEHWGAQFGIAPPDLAASRFFSTLCCFAAQPALGVAGLNVLPLLVPLGNGFLGLGDPTDTARLIEERRLEIRAQRRVGAPEMIAAALGLIGAHTQPPQADEGPTPVTALVLDDFVADQAVLLLLPM
jgi:hypothetical protein